MEPPRHVLAKSSDPSAGRASDGARLSPFIPPPDDAAHAATAGIEIRDLEKRYAGALALDVPRLDVAPRTTLAIIGPSGCGKSTLLRLIVGLVTPDRGTIAIGGVPMGNETKRALRLRIGYVIQEGGLFPHLTARENVTLVAHDLGWTGARIDERVAALLELTRLPATLLDRYPSQVSGGQRQRLALMRALMLDPEVLLMDEPLAALDPMIRADLQRELAGWFERLKKTVVLVTHDLGEAAFLGDEIAVMKAGQVIQRGSFDVLDRTPLDPIVTEFIRAQRAPEPVRRGEA
jgi:osmoprotectant transport system ATP-binding protein